MPRIAQRVNALPPSFDEADWTLVVQPLEACLRTADLKMRYTADYGTRFQVKAMAKRRRGPALRRAIATRYLVQHCNLHLTAGNSPSRTDIRDAIPTRYG